jgi:hypothetical protein
MEQAQKKYVSQALEKVILIPDPRARVIGHD